MNNFPDQKPGKILGQLFFMNNNPEFPETDRPIIASIMEVIPQIFNVRQLIK